MALRATNTSEGKVIGVGKVTILPGMSEIIPTEYEDNPVLRYYKEKGFVRLTTVADNPVSAGRGRKKKNAAGAGDVTADEADPAEPAETEDAAEPAETEDPAEAMRKARLASLKNITEEGLGKLAEELGISPAECKNAADMKKKVRAALEA